MNETIFIKHLIEKEMSKYKIDDCLKSQLTSICTKSYIEGYKDGRLQEQTEFLKQAEKQLSIVKDIKKYLIENKNFKVLHYVEKLERERK